MNDSVILSRYQKLYFSHCKLMDAVIRINSAMIQISIAANDCDDEVLEALGRCRDAANELRENLLEKARHIEEQFNE